MERSSYFRIPHCFLCDDKGIVIYEVPYAGTTDDVVAKCLCIAGSQRKEAFSVIGTCFDIPDLRKFVMQKEYQWYQNHPNTQKGA